MRVNGNEFRPVVLWTKRANNVSLHCGVGGVRENMHSVFPLKKDEVSPRTTVWLLVIVIVAVLVTIWEWYALCVLAQDKKVRAWISGDVLFPWIQMESISFWFILTLGQWQHLGECWTLGLLFRPICSGEASCEVSSVGPNITNRYCTGRHCS